MENRHPEGQETIEAFAYMAGLDPKSFTVFCRLASDQKVRGFNRCLRALATLWKQSSGDKKVQTDIIKLVWKLGQYPALSRFSLMVKWPRQIFINRLKAA